MASQTTTINPTTPTSFEPQQTKNYSFSLITHQRRPALIPTDSMLSPEDEQSLRMRTGKVNPLEPADELTFLANSGGKTGTGTTTETVNRSGNGAARTGAGVGGKRKASALDRDDESVEESDDIEMRED